VKQKGQVSYCHHLAFVVRRRPSVVRRKRLSTFKSSPLKPLNQIKSNQSAERKISEKNPEYMLNYKLLLVM
jgi:hypothetical protein